MKTRFQCVFVLFLLLGGARVEAGPVTDWHTFRASQATTLVGQGTDSPVWGSYEQPSISSYLVGYFKTISLRNPGDRIILTFKVTFTDASGMTSNDDQFRFGLYDINGQKPVMEENVVANGISGRTDDWKGYWFGVDGEQLGVLGSIRKRTGVNVHPIANIGTALLSTPTGTPVKFQSAREAIGGPLYSGKLAIEKTPTGLALAGFFGGNGTTNSFAANDIGTLPQHFSAVGFLNGATTDCEQINLQDVKVRYAVSNAIVMVADPSSTSAKIGETAEFQVGWRGTGIIPMIQWRENGTNIAGATNRVLHIAVKDRSQHLNVYNAMISNVFGDSVTSAEAVLTVSE